MFGFETFNPASIAENDEINIFGLQRLQWIGMPNAPQTTFFAANMPLKLSGKVHNAGLIFYNDKAGIFSTQSVNMQYAYKFRLGEGSLSFGGNIGFVNQTIHGDSVRDVASDYHNIQGDGKIPSQSVNAMAVDFSCGAWYNAKNWYAGVSMLHVFEPTFQLDDNIESFIGRVFYLTGGCEMPLINERFRFYPSFLYKTDFISFQAEIDARLEMDKKYWGGIGWRYQDAVILFLGINLSNGLSGGYAFDLPTSKFIVNSAGSHELFLRFSFKLGTKKLNKYKSVRVL
jgi:type IX secretion system PorP/SprF family membrane protein